MRGAVGSRSEAAIRRWVIGSPPDFVSGCPGSSPGAGTTPASAGPGRAPPPAPAATSTGPIRSLEPLDPARQNSAVHRLLVTCSEHHMCERGFLWKVTLGSKEN